MDYDYREAVKRKKAQQTHGKPIVGVMTIWRPGYQRVKKSEIFLNKDNYLQIETAEVPKQFWYDLGFEAKTTRSGKKTTNGTAILHRITGMAHHGYQPSHTQMHHVIFQENQLLLRTNCDPETMYMMGQNTHSDWHNWLRGYYDDKPQKVRMVIDEVLRDIDRTEPMTLGRDLFTHSWAGRALEFYSADYATSGAFLADKTINLKHNPPSIIRPSFTPQVAKWWPDRMEVHGKHDWVVRIKMKSELSQYVDDLGQATTSKEKMAVLSRYNAWRKAAS